MAELKEQTIEKEFVPYDLALELKDLGFDEECFGWYNYGTLCLFREDNLLDCYAGEENRPFAPSFSQAFRFFREKYHLIGCIDFHASYKNYMYNIKEFEYITHRTRIETYEDAELECIKKLIEIAKEQNVK